MGEYIRKNGKEYKLGTCEDLYYTTYKELARVKKEGYLSQTSGNDTPSNYLHSGNYRFRFPFADEDHEKEFGSYENFNRGLLFVVPKSLGIEFNHGEKFYRTDEQIKNAPAVGFRLPCIQGNEFPVKKFDWAYTSDFSIFEITQQKYVIIKDEKREGLNTSKLQTVVRCPYCNTSSRLDKKEIYSLLKYVVLNRKNFSELQIKAVIEAARGYKYFGGAFPCEVLK